MNHPLIKVFSLFLAASTILPAQAWNSFQLDLSERTCPYDTSQTGFYPTQYEVFRTLDDTYDGVTDSSWCASFVYLERPRRYALDLANFDYSRPLFIRLRYPEFQLPPIDPYTDHTLSYSIWSAGVALQRGPDCPGDCSQAYLRYLAVDPLNEATFERRFQYDLDASLPENLFLEKCFMSEQFTTQGLKELGVGLYLVETAENPSITIYGFDLEPFYEELARSEITEIVFPFGTLQGSTYRAFPSEVVDVIGNDEGVGYFVGQFTDRRPGPTAIRYTEANVEEHPDTMVVMELIFSPFTEDITFPPYTGLRGALVAGQDSLRHTLVLTFDEWYQSSCGQFLVDRPVAPNTVYNFGSDLITFGEDGACFVLEPGSEIAVRAESTLTYGLHGQGLLAAKENSKITVNAGATLTFDNTLRILHPTFLPEGGPHIYLNEGSRLVFAGAANVERKFVDSDSWIYVHNNGGSIDFGPLTAAERALFKFVVPAPEFFPPSAKELYLWPNPVTSGETLTLGLPPSEGNAAANLEILDMSGRVLRTGALQLSANGVAGTELPAHLSPGIYLLKVYGNAGVYVGRFVLD